MREQSVLWDKVALAALAVMAIGVAIWWLESRFGALVAVLSVGAMAGLVSFAMGAKFAQVLSKNTMENVADFIHEMMQTEKARQGVGREMIKLERDAFNQRAKLDIIDEKRIDQLAQQRAKMITSQAAEQPIEFAESDIQFYEVE